MHWSKSRWLLVACAVLAGCAVGPDFVRPPPPASVQFVPTEEGEESSSLRYGRVSGVPAGWWRLLGADQLGPLVDEALRNSPTLASAQAILRQSADARRAGQGVFMPQIGLDAGASRERSAPLRLGSSAPGSVFNVFTLGGSVAYVLDVFGGQRRRMEALGAEEDIARESARATYVALTANVATTSIARAAYRELAAVTREMVTEAESEQRLAESRYAAGASSYADVAAFSADAAALRATLPPIVQRQEQAGHLLSVLCGHAPADWSPPETDFGSYVVPAELPLTLPASLARQRPDIRVAEARLHVASADIGVATADLLPVFTLSGTLGGTSNVASSFMASQGRYWSGGVDLASPVFTGGTRWYGRRAAVEAYQASLADYRSVVLNGLGEVADVLRALEHDAEAVRAATEAERDARVSLDLIDANYRAGLGNYVTVLVGKRAANAARAAVVRSSAQQLQDTVALFVALGGDWSSAARVTVEGRAGGVP